VAQLQVLHAMLAVRDASSSGLRDTAVKVSAALLWCQEQLGESSAWVSSRTSEDRDDPTFPR
jgi:hypothetical protein